jgi:hypothetical protein
LTRGGGPYAVWRSGGLRPARLSPTRAAYIYQHRTSLRDKMIADEISKRVEGEQTRSGTQRARGNKEPS